MFYEVLLRCIRRFFNPMSRPSEFLQFVIDRCSQYYKFPLRWTFGLSIDSIQDREIGPERAVALDSYN